MLFHDSLISYCSLDWILVTFLVHSCLCCSATTGNSLLHAAAICKIAILQIPFGIKKLFLILNIWKHTVLLSISLASLSSADGAPRLQTFHLFTQVYCKSCCILSCNTCEMSFAGSMRRPWDISVNWQPCTSGYRSRACEVCRADSKSRHVITEFLLSKALNFWLLPGQCG